MEAATGRSTGDTELAGDVRASDAERDATIEWLSAATGAGPRALREFSQRMKQPGLERVPALVGLAPADVHDS